MSVARSLGKIAPSTSALFLCDMQVATKYLSMSIVNFNQLSFQVKFRPMISHFDAVAANSARVLAAAAHMGLPIAATEQYPK